MSTTYHDAIAFGAPATSANINAPLGELDQEFVDLIAGDDGFQQLNFEGSESVTIASGVITVTKSRVNVDTQSAAASDDLDTVNGADGDILFLRATNDARTVVIKHGTGNIVTPDGNDYDLDDTDKVAALIKFGSFWLLINQDYGTTSIDPLMLNAPTELTISSGSITPTQTLHTVDTQSDASSDDLDTIGTSAGDILYLRPASDARTVVIKNGTGNIVTGDGNDHDLDDTDKVAHLVLYGSTWILVAIIETAATSGLSYAILQEQQTSGTNAGTSSSTTWNNRTLNTEVSDPDSIVSISSNKFTPISGTYLINASAPAYRAEQTKIRLYNVTAGSTVAEGQSNYAENASNTTQAICSLNAVFTANGSTEYRIDHYTTNGSSANGLGRFVATGSNEVYLDILLTKIG